MIVVASTCVFGCASIAGLDDSAPTGNEEPRGAGEQNTTGTQLSSSSASASPSSGSSSSSGASGTPDGGDASTKPVDAGPDVAPPVCTKRQIGQTCSGNNDCCSDACANTGMCSNGCRGFFSGCGGDTPCCAGYVCRAFLCQLP